MKTNQLERGTAELIILDALEKQDNLTLYEIADQNGFIKCSQLEHPLRRLRQQQKIIKTGTKAIFSKEKQKRIAGCYTYSLLKKLEKPKQQKLRQEAPVHEKPVPECSNQESLTSEQLIKMGKGIASYISSLEQQNIGLRVKLHELENKMKEIQNSEQIRVNIGALKNHINDSRI